MSVLGQALGVQKPKKRNFYYPTIDPRCVPSLVAAIEAIGDGRTYAEPCAGAGHLIDLLEPHGFCCLFGLELEPQAGRDGGTRNRWPIATGNALHLGERDLAGVSVLISNLPWHRDWLHPLIWHLASLRPLWSLHDASWAYTDQAAAFGPICTDIAAVGRLKWFPPRGRPLRLPGEDYAAYRERAARHCKPSDPPTDCAWYRFDARPGVTRAPTRFHYRAGRDASEGRQARLL
jgi:hypothetical protein